MAVLIAAPTPVVTPHPIRAATLSGIVLSTVTTLIAGHSYQFDLQGSATGLGTLADPYMSVRDASGATKLKESENGGTGLNARFVYTATSTGTYFLAAGAGFNSSSRSASSVLSS